MRKIIIVGSSAALCALAVSGAAVAGSSTASVDPLADLSQVNSVKSLSIATDAQVQTFEHGLAFAKSELGSVPAGATRVDAVGAMVRIDQSGGCLRVDDITDCAPADVVARGDLNIQSRSQLPGSTTPGVLVAVDGVAPAGTDSVVATDLSTGKSVRTAVTGGVYHLRGGNLSGVGMARGNDVTPAPFAVPSTKP